MKLFEEGVTSHLSTLSATYPKAHHGPMPNYPKIRLRDISRQTQTHLHSLEQDNWGNQNIWSGPQTISKIYVFDA